MTRPAKISMMSHLSPDYRFKIALSFPGEVRQRVQNVAEILGASIPRESILYDRWLQPELARFNLDTYLTELYHKHSLLLVVFLSGDYERKEWCSLEWRTVRDLIKQKCDDRVMLLRLDDEEISGLRSIDGYLDIRHIPDTEVAVAILTRLAILTNLPLPEKTTEQGEPEADIPDAPQYWKQQKDLGPTPILNKIQERPRWCIWIRPAEFRPARFRDKEQCTDFMRRFTNTRRSRNAVFREDLLETGNDWVGCEYEDEGKFHLYLQRWVLFRSAQFVQNLALDHQVQLGDRTHVLEILDRVTVAYEIVAIMARDGIVSGKTLLSFSFHKVDGRQLTWPQDAIGDINLIDSNSWSEDDAFEIRRVVDSGRRVPEGRALALETSIAIYSKFRWFDPPRDLLKSTQMSRFGSITPD